MAFFYLSSHPSPSFLFLIYSSRHVTYISFFMFLEMKKKSSLNISLSNTPHRSSYPLLCWSMGEWTRTRGKELRIYCQTSFTFKFSWSESSRDKHWILSWFYSLSYRVNYTLFCYVKGLRGSVSNIGHVTFIWVNVCGTGKQVQCDWLQVWGMMLWSKRFNRQI